MSISTRLPTGHPVTLAITDSGTSTDIRPPFHRMSTASTEIVPARQAGIDVDHGGSEVTACKDANGLSYRISVRKDLEPRDEGSQRRRTIGLSVLSQVVGEPVQAVQ
jgi:hypothetical protein